MRRNSKGEIIDNHHILKKQRARGETWIDSGLNRVYLTREVHSSVEQSGSKNKQGIKDREELYKILWNSILDWNQCENLFDSTEMIAIRNMYMYCTIGYWKEHRPELSTFTVYRLCCEKVQEYYGDDTPLHRGF